jgi:hypothetical protein
MPIMSSVWKKQKNINPAYQNLHAATVDLLKLTKLEVIAVDYKFTLIEN